MDSVLSVLLFSTLLVISSCQIISTGECPSVNVQQDFDIEQYMGTWYEMERFFAIFEAFQDCVSADYTLDSSGAVIVNNTGYSHTFWNKGYNSIVGDAIAEDPNNPAKLSVRFFKNQPRGDYWVLTTDYSSYTVVWSCKEVSLGIFGKINTQFAWILTRQPEGITDDVRSELVQLMDSYGIKTSKFSQTNQLNCPGR